MTWLLTAWTILLRPLSYLVTITNHIGGWSYGVLFIVIFLESAFIAFAFLPGQSLLFLSSSIAANAGSKLNIWLLLIIFVTAATSGAMLKYSMTRHMDQRSRLERELNSSKLDSTRALFDEHERPSMLWGRFIPFIGLFIPVIAGTTAMDWRHFQIWNFMGVLIWVGICCFFGYYFGDWPFVENNFTWIMLALIFIPMLARSAYQAIKRHRLATN
ncbi:VTT domain-containing protein [Lactiplantibacillus sp. WILCCON 0030]|uniref:VTT domain-containing protein n=1 Tax=Lactiplantibacillus brownii TaxID=3069269 RepID=A0ABU1AAP9_9LACO|nr:VTT domain-containing protein [Lactiplantibacillus brownii]MDQ7937991.1 VTT domain-containing protein [Lactiplantibacillus brownii]